MLGLVLPILQLVWPAIQKAIPDTQKQLEVHAELHKALMEAEATRFNTLRDIIVTETQAGGLNAAWRPILAFFYIFLMAWSWCIVPVLNAALGVSIWTPDASTIATVGGVFTTAYGLGRTLEKGVSVNGR